MPSHSRHHSEYHKLRDYVRSKLPNFSKHDERIGCVTDQICAALGAKHFNELKSDAMKADVVQWYNKVCGAPRGGDAGSYYTAGAWLFGLGGLGLLIWLICLCVLPGT